MNEETCRKLTERENRSLTTIRLTSDFSTALMDAKRKENNN